MPGARTGQVPEITPDEQEVTGADSAKCGVPGFYLERHGKSGTQHQSRTAGTKHAYIEIQFGCSPMSHLYSHGGARNKAGRISEALTLKQVDALITATKRAVSIGYPLNRWITVHWEAAGLADAQAMQATTAFLKYWREWLKGQTAYVWVRENGGGKGSHTHILAHLPESRRLHGRRSMVWIERVTGQPYRARVVHTRAIAGASQPGSVLYAGNLQSVLSYALKGASPEVAQAIGINRKPGGIIIGKRCGTSRNIAGPTQQSAYARALMDRNV